MDVYAITNTSVYSIFNLFQRQLYFPASSLYCCVPGNYTIGQVAHFDGLKVCATHAMKKEECLLVYVYTLVMENSGRLPSLPSTIIHISLQYSS